LGACCELGQPRAQTGRLLRALLQDSASPLHEESSQVRVPAFANPQQLLLATSGIFARDDSEPGGELSPLFESCSVSDRGDDCGRRHRSDARDRYQPWAGFVVTSSLVDHRIGFVDPHLQVIELQPQLRQQHAQCAGELGAGVFQDPGQCRIDMASPLAQSDSTFEQQATNLVDELGFLICA